MTKTIETQTIATQTIETVMIEITNAEKTFTMHLQGGVKLP